MQATVRASRALSSAATRSRRSGAPQRFRACRRMGAAMSSSVKQLATGKHGEEVFGQIEWPPEFPFGPEALKRMDESSDGDFYAQPRFCTHIDDGAIGALQNWYGEMLPAGEDKAVLDICSSWISHYPEGYSAGRVAGLGMNAKELEKNGVLTEWTVKDLNEDPTLPYEDNSFDAVTNAVSIDYLCKPQEILKEVARVLKPGGLAAFSFSNRCFPTKVIGIWNQTNDSDHVAIVGSYFYYEPAFGGPLADDISPNPGRSDPMFVVYGRKEV
jgi:SAM-dependent methyltransferase